MWQLWRDTGVKYYLAVGGAGLLLVFLVLNQRGVSYLSCLLPLLVGAGGATIGWARTPIVYLVVLATVLSIEPNRYFMSSHGGSVWLTDMLLCAGVLAFVAAQYRLQSLLKSAFPPALLPADAETRPPGPAPASPRRASRSVSPREIGMLLLVLPAWAIGAQLVAALLPASLGNPGLRPAVWRGMTLLWLLCIAALVIASIFDFYHRRHMSPAEATLFLQDELWRETRREQRRHDRWRAWARLGFPLDIVDLLIDIAVLFWLATIIVFLVWMALWIYLSLSA
jgi:hypothetical protein